MPSNGFTLDLDAAGSTKKINQDPMAELLPGFTCSFNVLSQEGMFLERHPIADSITLLSTLNGKFWMGM